MNRSTNKQTLHNGTALYFLEHLLTHQTFQQSLRIYKIKHSTNEKTTSEKLKDFPSVTQLVGDRSGI